MTSDQLPPVAERAHAPERLPSLPADAGLSWRPLSAPDVPTWLELMQVVEEHDDAVERTSESELTDSFKGSWRDPETDTVGGFDDDGQLRAFARTEYHVVSEGTLAPVLLGAVHPDYRRRGIGRSLLEWSEARARQQLAATDSGLPARLRLFAEDSRDDIKMLAANANFIAKRWYRDMRRILSQAIPNPPDLGGIEIRPYRPELSERVRLTHNEAFAPDHWGSNPIEPEPWAVTFVGSEHFRPDWSFVAIDTHVPEGPSQIAGYTMSTAHEEEWRAQGFTEGWTDAIGVRREYRGRGVASALLIASMRAFTDEGLEYAGLGVDSANPTGALGLYSKLGYEPDRGFVLYTKELNQP